MKFRFAPTHLTQPTNSADVPHISPAFHPKQAHTDSEGRLLSSDFIVITKFFLLPHPSPTCTFPSRNLELSPSPIPEWWRPGKEVELTPSGWHLLEAFFRSVTVFVPQRLKERSEGSVRCCGLGWNNPFQAFPRRYMHICGCSCMCVPVFSHMCLDV